MRDNLEYLEKLPQKTVVIGLSGGVDSSVAALLLQEQGYQVIGVVLKLYSETKNSVTGECSYLEDLKMAKKVALQLDIPLYVLDFEKEYTKLVLQPMFEAYRKGLTPNPDLICNKVMKFPLLIRAAKQFKADSIATGHYARVRKGKKGIELLMGKDRTKDQSYFLAELSENDLKRVLFPLGDFTKKQVREIARKRGLPNWNKHGTVGICFVGQQNMQDLLREKIKIRKGEVFDTTGKRIGFHEGVAYYTIGQKAGDHIGIDVQKPQGLEQKRLYVAEKDLGKNSIVVAEEGDALLKKRELNLKKFHWIGSAEKLPLRLKVCIRHLGELHSGILGKNKGKYFFEFSKPVGAVAAGQIAVLYRGERVV